MEILTLGWVSLLVVFTWSIAMVVWVVTDFKSSGNDSSECSSFNCFWPANSCFWGIVYLTMAEWRDRRRQDREKRSAKRR